MNNRAKKQNEEQVRRWIRNIIKEDRQYQNRPLLMEFGWSYVTPSAMADTWIKPFANVFKVAKVAAKDITSSAKLNLDLLLTFDPDKMEKHHDNWAKRKSSIDAEYAKVMEPVNAALSTGDAALIGFMLNPAGFLGARLVAKGISSVPTAIKDLQDVGFDMKMAAALAGTGAATSNTLGGDDGKEPGVIGGTLKKLAKLFFIAHHAPSGDVLFEAEEEEKKPSGDMESGMEEYLEELGILDKIQSDANGLVNAKIEIINDVMDESRTKFEILDGIYQADSAEKFKASLEKAKSSDIDVGGGGLAAVGKELAANVDKMLKNPETKKAMIAAVLEKAGKKVSEAEATEDKGPGDAPKEEVNEDELRKHVEQVVFMQSKQALQEKIYDGVREMSDAALKVVMEDIPPEDEWDLISGSSAGRKMIDAIKSAIKEIKK